MRQILAFAICLFASLAQAADRPDVLLIMVDDLRPMLGCYGDPRIKTPNIDRLAKRSVVFDRAYCQYAKCGTSRLSLMTGLRPKSIGVFSNRMNDVVSFRKRHPNVVTLPKWLGSHNYFTRSFGKIDHDGWHVDADWSVPPSPGRDGEMLEVVDPNVPTRPTTIAERLSCPAIQNPDIDDDHLYAGRMTGEVIQAMKAERQRKRPTFFAVGYRRPHLPFVAPKRFFDLYHPDPSWLAKNGRPSADSPIMAWFNSDGYVGTARRIGLTMPTRPTRQEAIDWNGYELRSYVGIPNQGPIQQDTQLQILHAYAACVSYVDSQIGRLIDELESAERLDETIIVLASDHGWHLGEHGAWGKMTNFEIATRVPLIISSPGQSPARTQSIAELVDLYPTICELAGIALPLHLQGESIAGIIRDPNSQSDNVAYSQYSRFNGKNMGRAVRTNRFRYVVWQNEKTDETIHRELYDHQADAAETSNIADRPEFAAHIQRLDSLLQKNAE